MEVGDVTWIVERLADDDGSMAPVLEDSVLTISFGGDRIWGSSGCNSYSGPCDLGETVTIGPLAGTMMFCMAPDGVMDQERRFLDLLHGVDVVRVEEDELVLARGGTILVRAVPLVVGLEGTWSLLFHNNGTALVSTLLDTEVTATFESGSVHGRGGCNRYTGSYESGDGSLTVSPLATTRKMCPEPEVMEQERRYLALLTSAATYRIRDGRILELFDGEGDRILQYTRI